MLRHYPNLIRKSLTLSKKCGSAFLALSHSLLKPFPTLSHLYPSRPFDLVKTTFA